MKPENLVIDEKGYLRLTDFGIARNYRVENYKDTSGTPGYMGNFIYYSAGSFNALESFLHCRLFRSWSNNIWANDGQSFLIFFI